MGGERGRGVGAGYDGDVEVVCREEVREDFGSNGAAGLGGMSVETNLVF